MSDRERDWEEWGEQLERQRSPLEVSCIAIAIETACVAIVWLVWQWIR